MLVFPTTSKFYDEKQAEHEEAGDQKTNRGRPGQTMYNSWPEFLCIQISSASVERIFSTGGNTVNKKRSSLAADTMEDLILVHDNRDLLRHWLKKP